MQNYLKANKLNIFQELAETILKLRSKMKEVKINYGGKYEKSRRITETHFRK